MRTVYLDYNATTPIAAEVVVAMEPFWGAWYGNPSSTHALGRVGREAIEDARGRVAQLLSCTADEIYFTSGGTESNNLALKGVVFGRWFAAAQLGSPQESLGHLVISSVEHPAIVQPAKFLQRLGCDVTVVDVDGQGVVSPQDVAAAIRPDTFLVSIMHANNEIGTLQPLAEIAAHCRAHGVLLHTDAAQSVGKVPTAVGELGVDLLTIAGHKLYAPKGVGAIYICRGVALEPFLHGAGHERGLRAGTENVPYIVGLGVAAELARQQLDGSARRQAELRERLLARLQAGISRPLSVNGAGAPRLPNTLSVNFPGVSGGELLSRTPEVLASTGSACHSGTTHLSTTLEAMGVDPEIGRGCVRLTLGRSTTPEEIDFAADRLLAAWEQLVGAP